MDAETQHGREKYNTKIMDPEIRLFDEEDATKRSEGDELMDVDVAPHSLNRGTPGWRKNLSILETLFV